MMSKGEKAIILLLENNECRISKLRLVKLMFLISEKVRLYDFIPYKYGPFSFQLYHDLSRLEREGFVSTEDDAVCLIRRDPPKIDHKLKSIMRMDAQRFAALDDRQLLDYIYDKYPEYTIFSLYRRTMQYDRNSKGIVTIGYEGKTIDKFLNELIINKINVLIDVRRNAYSMKFGFQHAKLKNYLEKIGIDYIHIPELGIPTDMRKQLETLEDYRALFAQYRIELEANVDHLEKIKSMGQDKKVALMCFEKDIRCCHRGIIAERLREDGVEVIDL
jgi:uncharacterized protein (DUF488 family)